MNINIAIFQWLHAGAGTRPLLDNLAIFWAKGGPYLLAVLFVVLWFLVGKDKKTALLEATEAAGLGLIINQLIGLFYFHPRPFMMGLCTSLLPHAAENSFPSDHATLMFSAALYLLVFRGWLSCGLVILTAAALTAWGRIYVGVHFPFDMAGSFLVSLAAAWILSKLATRLTPLNNGISRLIKLRPFQKIQP